MNDSEPEHMSFYTRYLFSIYCFYTRILKQDSIPVLYVACVSGLVLFLNIYTAYLYLVDAAALPDFINSKARVLGILGAITALNYICFIKHQKFAQRIGLPMRRIGIYTVMYVLSSLALSVAVANQHRAML